MDPLTDQQLADLIVEGIRREDRDNWTNDLGTGVGFSAERTVATILADAALKAVKPELDRLRAELEQALTAWREVHEALISGCTPSAAMNLMDQHERAHIPMPGTHQSHCVAATQGCCSCEEPTAPTCSCAAEAVHQHGRPQH